MLTQLRGRARQWDELRRADAALISFPKCGRTWLRLMLGGALARRHGRPVDDADALIDLYELTATLPNVPRILVTHDDKPHTKAPEDLERSKARYRGKRVILLVRDPRDVIVSLYFERTRRDRRHPYDGTLHDFLSERVGGVESLVEFCNIWDHQRSAVAGLHVVRYEDLHRDALGELRAALGFLGVDGVGDDVLSAAVVGARFDRMREIEAAGLAPGGKLRAADPTDEESFKTRKGKVGGFAEYLDDAEVASLAASLERLAPVFGYGA